MLRDIAGFEIKYQIGSPVFIAVFAIFFLLTFGGVTIDQVQVGSTGAVNVNSPHAISTNVMIWSLFGLFIPTAFLVSGILRDASFKTEELFFTTTVREPDYLIGRFIGGFIVTMLAFASVPLAIMIGSVMPWLDPDNVGPFVLGHYLWVYFVIGVPNLLVAGLVMFTVANITRSNMATYVTLVALLILYFVGSVFTSEPEYRDMAALLDPFAFNTYGEVTRFWTPAELNTQVVPLEGVMLYNRLIWLGVAAGLFILNLFLFSFRRRSIFSAFRKKGRSEEAPFTPRSIELPRVTPHSGAGVEWTQFLSRIWFEIKGVVFNVAFWVLLALGMFNSIGGLLIINSLYGTPNYPVTRVMIDILAGSFSIIPLVVVVYYSAELIWRERAVRFSDIIDATPAPSWAFVFSKFIAMCLVLLGLMATAMLTSIAVQVIKGFDHIELGQYLLRLLVDFGLFFVLLAALSIFAQVITNNRWLGMLVVIAVFIGTLVMAGIGWEHNLYIFAGTPGTPYSDMNGYGHFLGIALWFYLYWGAFSGLLLIIAYMMWNRGALMPIWQRLAALPRAMNGVTAGALVILFVVFAGTGSYIYYNTNILNEYITGPETERQQAEYERRYREDLELAPRPKITAVSIDVDIYPYERRYDGRGTYTIENKTDEALDHIWVGYNPAAQVHSQNLNGQEPSFVDEDFNFFRFDLPVPMAPGDTMEFEFVVSIENPGFRNSGNGTSVVYNGTFFNNSEAMPSFGFNPNLILQDRQARRRQGLDPTDRAYPLEDESHWTENGISLDADFVTFRSIVSTSDDQIAIAPGYLTREWQEDGRNYFEYVMDAPILNFYAWLSADYEVMEEMWNDVALQIFYHAPHDYNLDRMMEGMRDSLAYFSENFSPFQHRQMRIMEFPAYASFAQSFPNTVPFSESIGFIADIRDPDNIDYVYYVTAHEVAHQWWAHQVMSANVQGGTMLVESFAQYSALMVMKHEYGEDHMRRFLQYELDSYLSARGSEAIEELPLYRVENQQYIHYRKGSVIMYALQDYLGEDTVNRVMARLIEERGFRGDPYATTLDFLRILREEAGPEWEQMITDFFERIIIFDLQVTNAETRQLEDGRWEVTIDVESHKFAADGQGEQTEEPIDYMIDIGVFSANIDEPMEGTDHVLYFQKHQINEEMMQFTFVVDEQPLYVGIDPYNKLIDRNSDDNLSRVTVTSE